MVKHIVCFKLSGSDEERREIALRFKNALMELPSKIDVLKSMDDVEIYAKHPAHVAAASILAGHKESRACVDYYFA